MRYVVKKGSVTVNGVSLTINDVGADGFEVTLIPHTLSLTNLAELTEGMELNVEFDWMVKVILNEASRLEILKKETY